DQIDTELLPVRLPLVPLHRHCQHERILLRGEAGRVELVKDAAGVEPPILPNRCILTEQRVQNPHNRYPFLSGEAVGPAILTRTASACPYNPSDSANRMTSCASRRSRSGE